MCGINGGWLYEGIPGAEVEKSLHCMRHRGPDEFGTFVGDPVFLGNCRLSIIDLAGGRQPVFNEDGSIVVVFNGEIYNYLELTRELTSLGHIFRTGCDTEVLAHLYEERGSAMCTSLRGMFAFAVWDARSRLLFIARDRFGKKPLYYTRTLSGGLLFASELKGLRSLAAAVGRNLSLDQQGIYDFLSLGVVPQPYTIFQDVFSLPAASGAVFDGNDLRMEKYWRLGYTPKNNLTYPEILERSRELIGEAVRIRLRSDVPLGLFLSGGMDSSIAAYEAAKEQCNLETFTVAVADPNLDESATASETAKFLDVRHTVLPLEVAPLKLLQYLVTHYDQPYADSSAIPSLMVARLAGAHVKVVINGDGGDELFAGYRRHLAAFLSSWFAWMPQGFMRLAKDALVGLSGDRRSSTGLWARFFSGLSTRGGERYLLWLTDMLRETDKATVWRGSPQRPTEEWINSILFEGLSPLDTQMFGDTQINLLSDLLVKMDMASMASSVEARSPFLDHVLAEFAASIPDRCRLRGLKTKAVLRDAYRGLLPERVVSGPKRGFEVPLKAWLEKDLREILNDTVVPASASIRSYLDGGFIDGVLSGRTMRDRNWSYIVYALLVLELWLREFSREAQLVSD